jgi:D-arginine dehydrogenase
MELDCDFLVIGAGISGAAAAFELAAHGKVAVLEAETRPGYHSTGRSAALYTRHYGGPTVRKLSNAALPFFIEPPPGFAEHPLLSRRSCLTIASAEQRPEIDALLGLADHSGSIVELSPQEALKRAPYLRPDVFAYAAFEEGIFDMDVAAAHQGFLRGLKARGGQVICDAPLQRLERIGRVWHGASDQTLVRAPVVVNAAGAWADAIAAMAGAKPVGLVPKRRTAVQIDLPPGTDTSGWPAVDEAGYGCYCKPEMGRILASPADATPSEPCDAQPDAYDVAVIADWLERMTTIPVRRINHKWAGLRSFVADEAPVAGFDDKVPGFFWLCGQGGYGIMLAPVLGQATAHVIQHGSLPGDLADRGLTLGELAPERLRR